MLATTTFDLNMIRDHLLIKDYLPSKFEAASSFWSSVLELSVAQGEVNGHDLWPTDLNINRDHLLIKGYLPTEFEASGARRSWVIICTRCGRPTWPLTLTWISTGIIYSSWTIYLPSLKFMRWGVVELLDAQVVLGGYRRTDRHVQSNMPLPSFEGGHNDTRNWSVVQLSHMQNFSSICQSM